MTDLVVKLRDECLKRGAAGIKGISRIWRIIDDDDSKTLSLQEFEKGIRDFGIGFSKEETQEIFKHFDKDSSGSLDFNEFLNELRVNINF
jgi:calcyphosin